MQLDNADNRIYLVENSQYLMSCKSKSGRTRRTVGDDNVVIMYFSSQHSRRG